MTEFKIIFDRQNVELPRIERIEQEDGTRTEPVHGCMCTACMNLRKKEPKESELRKLLFKNFYTAEEPEDCVAGMTRIDNVCYQIKDLVIKKLEETSQWHELKQKVEEM